MKNNVSVKICIEKKSPYLAKMGEETRASERCGPGGMATRFEPDPSRPLTVSMNLVSTSWFNSTSPKLMTSTLT